MNEYTFTPKIEHLGFVQKRTVSEIKDETMVWSADRNFALENGGPITREFLNFLDPKKDWIIDTRSHMLMPSWYPCIGGWHLDNMPRNTDNGQPNYQDPPFICDHVLVIIDAVDSPTQSLTEFLTTDVTLPEVNDSAKIVYGQWSPMINSQLSEGLIKSKFIESNSVITFDSRTFHRGQPAVASGWRFFARAMTNTPQSANNEIRKQVNVYIEAEAGW